MSLRALPFEDEDEQRRLSVFHLVGLAAGGVIGSGWMLGAGEAYDKAGSDAWLAWLFGGLLMLLIAGVMVELGTAAPKTGGLIFLPLQSSGALVATVMAAGLWLVYAINLASEAVAMTKGLSGWKVHGLLDPSDTLTTEGWCYALAFMAVISAVNLIAPRIFFRINSWLTVLKVVVPVLTVVLLIAAGFDDNGLRAGAHGPGKGAAAALTAVVGSGVIYAYVGFQGPLDFAGNVKRRPPGEAARLRRAVFGTIVGSMVLYIALQTVFTRYHDAAWSTANMGSSPYAHFAYAAGLFWLGVLLRINGVLSPMGAGLVFAHSLTREVAALSRAHLTHRGLQTARKASLNRRYDVYWLVLVVDCVIAGIALWAVGGSWKTLVAVTGVLTLVVYAVPGVALVSLRGHLPAHSDRRRDAHEVLARASFALIALILYGAGWGPLWRGMTALTVGCALLLCLPILAGWRPALGRIYDAKVHVTQFRDWRTSPAAQAALWLIGQLAVLMLVTLVLGDSPITLDHKVLGGFLAVVTALVCFEGLVRASKRHMLEIPPMLPTPGARGTARPAPTDPRTTTTPNGTTTAKTE
ncbi:APC family permease [Streptomyces cylindrosporus]|uniref:APC family permease n=1 Tax=Streptomyces cylindrosporus TaxID=2927583 RepID=A0ABS9Y6L2_9ACTN|nr:APC family permease [Streptomyces cylindrosporus]MCI3272848.1 APC family permease [Streptomyces cylindrosporus]